MKIMDDNEITFSEEQQMLKHLESHYLVEAEPNQISCENHLTVAFVLVTVLFATVAVGLESPALLVISPTLWFFGSAICDRLFRKHSLLDDASVYQAGRTYQSQTELGAAVAGIGAIGMVFVVLSTDHTTGALLGLGISGGLLLVLASIPSTNENDDLSAVGSWSSWVRSYLFQGLLLLPVLGNKARQQHEKLASTQSDDTSARMGESYYRFVMRFLVGSLLKAFQFDKNASARTEASLESNSSEFVQLACLALLYLGLAYTVGNASLVMFLFLQALVACWQITAIEYAEHYGMLRKQLANGKHEMLGAQHIWRGGDYLNNALLRGRASHAKALSSGDRGRVLPQWPLGLNLLTILVLCPPVWFRFANDRLATLVNFDLHKVNLDGGAYVALMERYHHPDGGAS